MSTVPHKHVRGGLLMRTAGWKLAGALGVRRAPPGTCGMSRAGAWGQNCVTRASTTWSTRTNSLSTTRNNPRHPECSDCKELGWKEDSASVPGALSLEG